MSKRRARQGISPNQAFWALVALLAGLSVYFAVEVEMRRRAWRHRGKLAVKSGDVVKLLGVIDGDELSVRHNKTSFVVRLRGIKAFAKSVNEPGMSHFGASAVRALRLAVRGKKLTVQFAKKQRDKHKRLLAYLHADGSDVGHELVAHGHVLVFGRYPFSREKGYLAAELNARTRKLGLWLDQKAVLRATALKAAWRAQRGDD